LAGKAGGVRVVGAEVTAQPRRPISTLPDKTSKRCNIRKLR
jgi:hypothetical protein